VYPSSHAGEDVYPSSHAGEDVNPSTHAGGDVYPSSHAQRKSKFCNCLLLGQSGILPISCFCVFWDIFVSSSCLYTLCFKCSL